MKLAIVADTFPPLRTSGAVQLRDLSRELVRKGHDVTVMLPDPTLERRWRLERLDGVRVLRLASPRTKDVSYLRRTVAEFLMPFAMRRSLRASPVEADKWDGVVWYAPSIFHGPLVSSLKKTSDCSGYLIIRDVFPEWAVDMGLMGRGLPYLFFDRVAQHQYSVADVIGVQTAGNTQYFRDWVQRPGRKLEVLQNWLAAPASAKSSLRVSQTSLAGRKIFVYAGNMGVAQGLDILIDLTSQLSHRQDVGFLFVGRGSEAPRLKAMAEERQLSNVAFFDEIDPDEIPDLYSQCAAGIVSLDPRHKSHNIPGKFLTYMQCGLPVLANVNRGNDLADLIRREAVGQVCESNAVGELLRLATVLLKQVDEDSGLADRCRALFRREYSVEHAAEQIVKALHPQGAAQDLRPLE